MSKLAQTASSKAQSKSIPSFPTKYLFRQHHQKVMDALAGVVDPAELRKFNKKTTPPPRIQHQHSTHLVASFRCPTPTCRGRRWSSGVVCTAIRAYHDNTYNATVYNQRCRACNTLGSMKLDVDVYVDRVSYWLKKWAGVKMELPHAGEKKNTPPHEVEYCEGCKAGLCMRGQI